MQDFESKLRDVSLRRPSPGLDRRIQTLTSWEPYPTMSREKRISLGWAFAFALLMGIVGFAIGVRWDGKKVSPDFSSFPQTQVHIIYYPAGGKPIFDFTQFPQTQFINTDKIEVITEGDNTL